MFAVEARGRCLFLAIAASIQLENAEDLDEVMLVEDADVLRVQTFDHAASLIKSENIERFYGSLLSQKLNKPLSELRLQRLTNLVNKFKADKYMWSVPSEADLVPPAVCYICAKKFKTSAACEHHKIYHLAADLEKAKQRQFSQDLVLFEQIIPDIAAHFIQRKLLVWDKHDGVSIVNGYLEDDGKQLETNLPPVHLFLKDDHFSALKILEPAKDVLETITNAAVNNHNDIYISNSRMSQLVNQASTANLAQPSQVSV